MEYKIKLKPFSSEFSTNSDHLELTINDGKDYKTLKALLK